MNIVTLDEIYAHTRIDSNAEESLLTLYADAAEATVLGDIDRSYEECLETFSAQEMARLKQAVLLLVDNSYQNRSPVSPTNMYLIPYTYESMIKGLMKLS